MRCIWFVRRPRTFGATAVVLTPERRLVLVRHSYVRGWFLPGGGIKAGEDARSAILRELHEEIGLRSYGAVTLVGAFEHRPSFKRDRLSLFIVENALFEPPRSWEIESVRSFALEALPQDLASASWRWLGEALGTVSEATTKRSA